MVEEAENIMEKDIWDIYYKILDDQLAKASTKKKKRIDNVTLGILATIIKDDRDLNIAIDYVQKVINGRREDLGSLVSILSKYLANIDEAKLLISRILNIPIENIQTIDITEIESVHASEIRARNIPLVGNVPRGEIRTEYSMTYLGYIG